MPVGLHLIEKVEERLLDAGLLPADTSVLHRVIDFARGDFTLRWKSPETGGLTVSIRIVQQLADRALERPVVLWFVSVEELEEGVENGRLLYANPASAKTLARNVVDACGRVLAIAQEISAEQEAGASADPLQ